MWPGYGENIRVIDWIIRRLEGDDSIAKKTAIGYVPAEGALNLKGLDNIDIKELLSVPKDYWQEDAKEVRKFIEEQVWRHLQAYSFCVHPDIFF